MQGFEVSKLFDTKFILRLTSKDLSLLKIVHDNDNIILIVSDSCIVRVMTETMLHANMMPHILSWADWVSNYFPQRNPKKKEKKPSTLSCYRCWASLPAPGPCIFHSDVFVLAVPTKHVGLVMGKGKTKFFEILSSSGLSRLTVPRVIAENDTSETEIELKGTETAVVTGVDMIGRAVQRQVRIGPGRWRCCDQGVWGTKCNTCMVHLVDIIFQDQELLVETKMSARAAKVFSLDCEWVYTERGGELTRVTVLDYSGAVCYDKLVIPPWPIKDFNTRYSGITMESLAGVTTSLRQVQVDLVDIISSKDIIVGHSLQHDLQALHLIHRNVVDTSLVFPHPAGPLKRNSLRFLAQHFLERAIQTEPKGHNSVEDALACLDLIKLKCVHYTV